MSRVLVIDDETVVGTILRYAFEANGHQTVYADGGERGVAMARSERPDAIVLDLMMPTLNGYDVLGILRSNEATKDVPILILTAVTMSDERERCLDGGADMVMIKPFDPRDVARAVDALLSAASSTAATG